MGDDWYLENPTSGTFWELQRKGKSYTTRTGMIGTEGKARTKSFPSASVAEMKAHNLLLSKKNHGFLSATRRSRRSTAPAPKASAAARPKSSARGRHDWAKLLPQWSRLLGDDEDVELATGPWARRRAASDEVIARAEGRLGVSLPPSYRSFLRESNGWRALGPASLYPDRLLPVGKIGWLRDKSPDTLKAWMEGAGGVSASEHRVYGSRQDVVVFRAEYLHDCLQISDDSDSGVLLLNPKVRAGNEWEAWHLASFKPGARRYRSFWQLCEQLVAGYGRWR